MLDTRTLTIEVPRFDIPVILGSTAVLWTMVIGAAALVL